MVNDVLTALSLTPRQAEWIGATALVVIVLLDVFASGDDVPGNTPREWLLRLTQWGSPFKWLWITGALVPFGLGCLAGHFFYPWSSAPLDMEWSLGLGLAVAVGLVFSSLTYFRVFRARSAVLVFVATLFGLMTGALLWPVK